MYKFGIEAEYALVKDGSILSYRDLSYPAMQEVIDVLPEYNDGEVLVKGDIGIKSKRWYLEGDERFDEHGNFITSNIKGVEIRTTPKNSLDGVCEELEGSKLLLARELGALGLQMTSIGFHPTIPSYEPVPPYNLWEQAMRQETPAFAAADVYMLSFGPDLNLSSDEWNEEFVVDVAKKLTYYSPFIVPFSFSSPFYEGKPWNGFSKRTYERNGRRSAVRVFVSDQKEDQQLPRLVVSARLSNEVGRIEFKAFDAIEDEHLYKALFALIVGIANDTKLQGRSSTPDAELFKLAAKSAFNDEMIRKTAQDVLNAASKALNGTEFKQYLDILFEMIDTKRTPAHAMIESYHATGVISGLK